MTTDDLEKQKKYVAIDEGRFSGKHPFVSSSAFSLNVLKKGAEERGDKIIEVTNQEWAYIQIQYDDIEILFNGEEIEEGKNRFFY